MSQGVAPGQRDLVRYRAAVYDSNRWHGFELRAGDIVISTPPKCGTTWVQMICALLVFQEPVLERSLSELSPWLDMLSRARCDVVADLDAQCHRRFIKTHTPLDGLPLDASVHYICVGRDPRDVALSMDNHVENLKFDLVAEAQDTAAEIDGFDLEPYALPTLPDSARERFWQWVDDERPPTDCASSLRRTLHHLGTFWSTPEGIDVILIHFDDLLADLESQMRALADRLAIAVDAPRWPALISAATFGQMRARAAMIVPNANRGFWHDNERFFSRGTSGQWRTLLDDHDLERYWARANAIGPPDLVAWVHRGW